MRKNILEWRNSIWASNLESISSLASGRDGILSYGHVDKVARLALRIHRTMAAEEFHRSLKMMRDSYHRELLLGVLREAVEAWDEEEKAEKRRMPDGRVAEYDAAVARLRAWTANPANKGQNPPVQIATIPPKPASGC
jgi:hypothetical protein